MILASGSDLREVPGSIPGQAQEYFFFEIKVCLVVVMTEATGAMLYHTIRFPFFLQGES